MAEGPALGSQAVDFSVLVRKAAEASVSGLKELCETSPDLSDTEKIGLLKFIVKTRQRLLRLVAVTKWCRQVRHSTVRFLRPLILVHLFLNLLCNPRIGQFVLSFLPNFFLDSAKYNLAKFMGRTNFAVYF